MRVYRQNPRAAARILEGRAFVVTPDDHKLHTLNETATEIWRQAADGCTAKDAAAALADHFAIDEATALADAERCCDDLVVRSIFVCDS